MHTTPTANGTDRETLVAHALACVAHYGQTSTYSKEIYSNHLRRVAGLTNPRYKPVAWLHDVLEDTALTPDHLLVGGISEATVRSVKLLTRLDEGQTYDQYLDSLITSGDEGALIVKVNDLRDHIRSDDPQGGRAVVPLDRIVRDEVSLGRLRIACLNR